MISGVRCCISGAWAPSTSKVSVPPDFLPAGNWIDSGEETLAVALADDLAPAADHRALDEAEALECQSADIADDVARRARIAAARRIVRASEVVGSSPSHATMP